MELQQSGVLNYESRKMDRDTEPCKQCAGKLLPEISRHLNKAYKVLRLKAGYDEYSTQSIKHRMQCAQ